jgi:hypothetical protein
VRQEFWAVWDRQSKQLWERTRLLNRHVQMLPGRVLVRERDASFDIVLEENPGFQVVTPTGGAYTWTRKQLVRAHGSVEAGGKVHQIEAVALIDDNAGYHSRHTLWQWSGGAGYATDGRAVGWSVIVGLNDSPYDSERTVWVEGEPVEVGPGPLAAFQARSLTASNWPRRMV